MTPRPKSIDWLPTELPVAVEESGLQFVPLTPLLVEADYAAVMTDPVGLQRWSASTWPTADFTIAENLADLERHEREQIERVALTYSVLVDGVVRGCIYAQPVADALRARDIDDRLTVPAGGVAVRGWLHGQPATTLIGATMSWLGRSPFAFPRLWWQVNELCAEQLSACAELGLDQQAVLEGADVRWFLFTSQLGA